MRKVESLLIGAAGLGVALASSHAYALPTCAGGTIALSPGGGTVVQSNLGSTVCVSEGDKIFSAFSFSGLGTGGSVNFGAVPSPSPFVGTYDLAFQPGVILGPGTYSGFGFTVDVSDPTVALLHDLEKDNTINASPNFTLGASTTLTGTTTPATNPLSCTRTLNPTTSSCAAIDIFPTDLTTVSVSETLVVGANTTVSSILDAVSEVAVTHSTSTPEPASLALLGSGLVGMALLRRRRKAA